MEINRQYPSPNFDRVEIPVEFLLLHYTACTLETTLDLFLDPNRELTSQLVLDEDGQIYELVPCWDGITYRARHAGLSYWMDQEVKWEAFNNFSIGIEIVNLNGNLFPYTDTQYAALNEITSHLRSIYPALNDPRRVIGHEQIAGWRGKVDPGFCFDWERYYQGSYPGMDHPVREVVCHPKIAKAFSRFVDFFPKESEGSGRFWSAVSHAMETSNRLIQEQDEK